MAIMLKELGYLVTLIINLITWNFNPFLPVLSGLGGLLVNCFAEAIVPGVLWVEIVRIEPCRTHNPLISYLGVDCFVQ